MSGKVRELDHDWRVATLSIQSIILSAASMINVIQLYISHNASPNNKARLISQ